jgi:4-hydroxybenzoate polyprenyltransferase
MVPLKALIRITRLWNLIIIGLAQYCTAGFLISPNALVDPRLFILAVSTILIAAGGYSINDYYDVKIDLINKPERVVVGKTLARRTVLLLHTVLSISGIGLGFVLGWPIGIINAVAAFLLWLYSNALKRLPFVGNFLVAILTGVSVLVVNVLYTPPLAIVWVYAIFALFMTLIREIIKDMEDLKGDDTFGCRTLPIVWGMRPTKAFIYFLIVLFCAVVISIHTSVAPLPVMFFLGFLLLPMGVMVIWLIRADTRKDFYRLSVFNKLIMMAGIFSMAFL